MLGQHGNINGTCEVVIVTCVFVFTVLLIGSVNGTCDCDMRCLFVDVSEPCGVHDACACHVIYVCLYSDSG
jgi:hypothetical protein